MQKVNIAISACLLGENCRYDGLTKKCDKIELLKEKYNLIPICPECLGGLPTPRIASEIYEDKVINLEGFDNTSYFSLGAKKALAIYKENNCAFAVLKERSPSCGVKMIHDGSFSNKLIKGSGWTTRLFKEEGIKVYSEDDIDLLV